MGSPVNTMAVAKPKIVKGDTVVLRRGKEKGKRGIVKAVFPKDGVATVEGLNVVKRHTKPGQTGQAQGGGIIEKEAPIPLSALMVIDPKTDRPTRVRRVRQSDGTTVRVSVKSGEQLLVPSKA
ncbi:50S ribosomal protein L24 [Vulcanimicrobium alpinum]|uniref:Large ribosomal subunit protein uL24 n=1 Tax=Vulcanimicrobium alpinum TaxID=3016050 RepID=A0AAN2CAC0_UNVUL|nr:50S ribosomal protein L24 [Vulcanimicrobium alpinum]BDE06763.1 50S ribosomal protein L24 [Vulcanimicrobium alpinum]